MLNKQRDIAIDITKGLAIILMVIGHVLPQYHPARLWIYSFHMPLFFVLAGLTYKPKQMQELIIGSSKRLLVPFFICVTICLLLTIMRGNPKANISQSLGFIFPDSCRFIYQRTGYNSSAGTVWFLFALFWCRIYMNILYKYFSRWYLWKALLISIACGYFGKYVINLPFGMLVGACGLFYMAIGKTLSEKKDKLNKYPSWVFLLFIPFWLYISNRIQYEMYGFSFQRKGYIISMATAAIASVIVYLFIGRLHIWVQARNNSRKRNSINLLITCGVNSLSILIGYQIWCNVRLLIPIVQDYQCGTWSFAIMMILGSIVTSYVVIMTKRNEKISKMVRKACVWVRKKYWKSQKYIYQPNKLGWMKYGTEPVYGTTETGSIFDPFVCDNGKMFVMIASERLHNCILRIDSSDGIHWQDSTVLLSNIPNTWQHMVNRASMIFYEGLWHLWYTGQSPDISCIGHSVSVDGLYFENAIHPCVKADFDYEGVSVMNPCVHWNGNRNVFQMWYAAGDNYEPDVICYAESQDGDHWNKMNYPVLTKYTKHRWEKAKVGGCDVEIEEDGSFTMYYIGYQNVKTARICYAKSLDGIHWERPHKNLLISPSKGAWDEDACYKPAVQQKGNTLYMWYNGRRGDEEYIGLATKGL